MRPLPFASIVVASSNDPHVTLDRARELARAWGSRFLELPGAGHINSESGYGPWPEAEAMIRELLAAASRHRRFSSPAEG